MKDVLMKLRKFRDCSYGTFNSTLKKMAFSTSTSETSENLFLFVFILLFVSLESVYLRMQWEINCRTGNIRLEHGGSKEREKQP